MTVSNSTQAMMDTTIVHGCSPSGVHSISANLHQFTTADFQTLAGATLSWNHSQLEIIFKTIEFNHSPTH